MSDIVNVGIQQGGIESPAPDRITADGLEFISLFMNRDETEFVNDSYERGTPDMGPANVFFIKGTDEKAIGELGRVFALASCTFVNLAAEMAEHGGGASDGFSGGGLSAPAIYSLKPAISALPYGVIETARKAAEESEDSVLLQTGVMFAHILSEDAGADTSAVQSRYIMRVGLSMLLIAMAGGAAAVIIGYLASRAAAGVSKDIRHDTFRKIESFSGDEFDKFSSASLITRCTNDVAQVQMLVGMGLRFMCYAPIMCVGGIIMAVRTAVSMSWIIALAVALLLTLIVILMAVSLPKFKIIQKLVDRLNLVAREELNGLMVIRAFGAQAHEKERFGLANKELTDTNLFVNRVMALMFPVLMLLMNGATILILWVGASQIAESRLQIGNMMAFIQYAMNVIFSFLMISMMFVFIPRAAVSAARIAEVLDTEPAVKDPETPAVPAAGGLVEFRDVRFRYNGAENDALTGVTFTAEPGKTTAIIGATGAGKSTVANLLMRFYDATGGSVSIDGIDVREMAQKDLRGKIGYVPQKSVLMSGTIESNIKYGNPDMDDVAMDVTAQVAQALEFINEKPEGFKSEIAQGGTNVSGGQKQRLSIARALAVCPEILVFDDSFSALDFKTDAALRKCLRDHSERSTVIVITQRVSSIMNAENIIVLDEGKIIGQGAHAELMESCPEYNEIAASQLTAGGAEGKWPRT